MKLFALLIFKEKNVYSRPHPPTGLISLEGSLCVIDGDEAFYSTERANMQNVHAFLFPFLCSVCTCWSSAGVFVPLGEIWGGTGPYVMQRLSYHTLRNGSGLVQVYSPHASSLCNPALTRRDRSPVRRRSSSSTTNRVSEFCRTWRLLHQTDSAYTPSSENERTEISSVHDLREIHMI